MSTTSFSKCPPAYVRPRVVLLHSESSWTRDTAKYVGAQLAMGGYAEVDVASLIDVDYEGMAIRELKAYLSERGVNAAGAAERSDLVELAKKTTVQVQRLRCRKHSETVNGKSFVVTGVDLRVHSKRDNAKIESAAMIGLVVATAEEARAASKIVRKALEGREPQNKDVVPVIVLTVPGRALFAIFDAQFGDDAMPLPKEDPGEKTEEEEQKTKKSHHRDLGGRAVVVDAALGFGATRCVDDGALVALGGAGKLVLERLDKEREASLAKFYDLLTSSDLSLTYAPRKNMTTVTWGTLLIYGPLLAAATIAATTFHTFTYREALEKSRDLRIAAAAATREVRLVLGVVAKRVKQRKDHDDDKQVKGRHHQQHRKSPLWEPSVEVAQTLPFLRLFEWILCAPNVIFALVGARYALKAPRGALLPDSTVATLLLDELRTACAGRQTPALDALQAALVQARVNPSAYHPDLIAFRNLGNGVRRDFSSFLAMVVLVVLGLLGLVLLLELGFPDRRRSERSFFGSSSADEF